MTLSEFARLYPLRCKNMALLCGAGTSVSAGMPSANDLIWDFKRIIYCAEERYPLSVFNNLSSDAIRNQIQAYFDSKGSCPRFGSIEEYSFYFEYAYPSAKDRSNYLMQKLSGIQNSFGHKVMGVLMKHEFIPLIFTTNFDKAFENSAVDQLKTMDKFFVGSMDNADTAQQKFNSNFRPLIIKLHGDYFSERLKNTSSELQSQDNQLRSLLFKTCLSHGLIIMGYSGRDKSIIETLNTALEQDNSFPQGIFWFNRIETEPIPEVLNFIAKAKEKGIQAEIIDIETFDTTWAELIKMFPNIPKEDEEKLNENHYKRGIEPMPPVGTKYPYIRFNALTVSNLPSSARLFKCSIGNTQEVVDRIKLEKGNIIAIRKADGIVGFGPDSEFDRIFSNNGPTEKSIFQIPDKVFNYEDSTLKGLITEALLKAITLNTSLVYRKRRDRYLIFPHPQKINDPIFSSLSRELENKIRGIVPNTNIQWIIGIEISIQKKMSEYFLLLSPTIIAAKIDSPKDKFQVAAFIKEATARWYNFKYSKIFDAWLDVIFKQEKEIELYSFDQTTVGFNPYFKLKRESTYTKSL